MNSPAEKYNGYDIYIKFEGLIRGTTFYRTVFTVNNKKANKAFYLLCDLSDIKLKNEWVQLISKKDVPGTLRKVGLKKVRELIDLQQFEYEDKYIGAAEFDGESWQCVITEIRQKRRVQ